MNWTVRITEPHAAGARSHLFPGDGEEHAAFLLCGLRRHGKQARLLVRSVVLVDDIDFGPSDKGGVRQISPRAVARAARLAQDDGLAVVWVHSHPGAGDRVGFSPQDEQTHAEAVPALAAITSMPVGALVFGEHSAAGMVTVVGNDTTTTWPVDHVRVVGRGFTELTSRPTVAAGADKRYARQIQMFGAAGQARLRRLVVAVIGAGGGGSLLIQMLAHLGVGTIVIVDFDIVERTNLSRIVGARLMDALRRRKKIAVARRLVRRIDPTINVVAVDGDITYQDDAATVADADFVFLATDTVYARWAFNLICYQHLIQGVQVGAKVTATPDGTIDTLHVMNRTVDLVAGCLDCMGAIPADALADEQLSDAERRAQRYVDTGDEEVMEEASVITLNSIATSLAATDFLLLVAGLHRDNVTLDQLVYHPLERSLRHRPAARRPGCRICDPVADGAFARGDTWPLQLRPGSARRSRHRPQLIGLLRALWGHLRR